MRYIITIFLAACFCASKAQLLFYQNTFKGGVCGDGKSYSSFSEYLTSDTIFFQNQVPSGSTIKKAFLISHKGSYLSFPEEKKETPVDFNLNNNIISFDSTDNITPTFYCDNSIPSSKNWIVLKDVTSYVLSGNNFIITPNQVPSSYNYLYIGVYLIILYENSLFQNTSFSLFINNNNYTSISNFNLTSLNSINNTFDVGLSIWTQYSTIDAPQSFYLSSASGNFFLGTLIDKMNNSGKTLGLLPGSFDYQNSALYGLKDDTPDLFLDSTDALVNIKNYIPNNVNTLNLQSFGKERSNCINMTNSFFLAYTTPCPARGFNDTVVKHILCQGQSIALNTQSVGNTYTWYPVTTLNNANIATPIATPTTTTNYVVNIDSAGCKHTEKVQVAVTPKPSADTVFISNNICGGPSGSIIIKPNHGPYEPYSYSLNSAAGVNDTSFTNLIGGNYNVLVTDTRGCTWQSNNFVIKDTIMVNAIAYAFPTSGIAPFTTQLSATATTGANNYNWYINNQFESNAWYYNQTFTDSGTYSITLIAYNNIPTCADTTTLTIIVLPQDTAGIFIPNVFSPNNDGVNDNFELKIKNAELELFEIYDRWGVQVSSTLDLTKENVGNITHYNWSGLTTSGVECSDGTYFYVIKIKLDEKYSKEGTKEYMGFITLLK